MKDINKTKKIYYVIECDHLSIAISIISTLKTYYLKVKWNIRVKNVAVVEDEDQSCLIILINQNCECGRCSNFKISCYQMKSFFTA